jgi:hypothetical protein
LLREELLAGLESQTNAVVSALAGVQYAIISGDFPGGAVGTLGGAVPMPKPIDSIVDTQGFPADILGTIFGSAANDLKGSAGTVSASSVYNSSATQTNTSSPAVSISQQQLAELKALREEIAVMRKDMAAIGTAQVVPLKAVEDRLRTWDADGLPPGRDDVTLLQAA